MQIKYFDKDSLTKHNNYAIKHNLNRSIYKDVVAQLDSETLFPVVWTIDHNDAEMRCKLMLSPTTEAWLDLPLASYNKLPSVNMPTH